MKQWYYVKRGMRFGPLQLSQILELYRKGEIAPDDLVWEEGTPNWVKAETVLGPLAVTPEVPELTPHWTPPPPVQEPFSPVRCIQQGWDLVWRYPLPLIGGTFLALMIASVGQILCELGSQLAVLSISMEDSTRSVVFTGAIILEVIGFIVAIIIQPMMYMGIFKMLLHAVRGNEPNLGDIFVAFKERRLALTVILACLAVNMLVFFGIILLIIPGIYLGAALAFTMLIVIDQRQGVVAAMQQSMRTVNTCWWRVFGLLLLILGVLVLGLLACCVGMFIAAPITYAALVYAYQTLFINNNKNIN